MSEITFPDGATLPAIPYRSEREIGILKRDFMRCHKPEAEAEQMAREGWPERCPDCQCATGKDHGPGCDWEKCPRCEGQIIGCGCLDDGEDWRFYTCRTEEARGSAPLLRSPSPAGRRAWLRLARRRIARPPWRHDPAERPLSFFLAHVRSQLACGFDEARRLLGVVGSRLGLRGMRHG